jgi:putative transposase
MLLSFKTELKPNNIQSTLFKKASGTARHAYNWACSTVQECLANGEKTPSSFDLHKRLVAEVKPLNSWYYEVSKNVPQKAISNLRTAWDRCFKKLGKAPRFKKKGQRDSFYLEAGTIAKPMIKNNGKRVKLPTIGWVRLAEPLPLTAVHNCVISRQANKWFISIKYDVQLPEMPKNRPSIGVDVGIKELAVCSNGKVFENPKAYRRMLKKLKQLQRAVSRKIKGSSNRTKAVRKLAKIHARVLNIRKDGINKLTTYLAKNHGEIKIEVRIV